MQIEMHLIKSNTGLFHYVDSFVRKLSTLQDNRVCVVNAIQYRFYTLFESAKRIALSQFLREVWIDSLGFIQVMLCFVFAPQGTRLDGTL